MTKLLPILIFNLCLLAFLTSICPPASAQSSEYTIESFQSNYTELTSYQSVALLTKGDPLWEYEFQLGFPFPFYDSVYTRFIYRHDAWGSFTDDQDIALLLMYSDLTYENVLDTFNITSDVRFSNVQSGSMQAFVIQFTKARFFADPFEGILDTYLNFQLWFYESGVIEVHFGEMHMDGTPIYAPGKGFYCYTTSGGVDTTDVCGPTMLISDPLDEENGIALEGAWNDYDVVGYPWGYMTVLPPEGWVIRFKPTSVATSNLRYHENLVISPNPANEFVHLPDIKGKVVVFDGTGRIVYDGYPKENKLNVSGFPSGIYYIQIISEDRLLSGKFIRQ